MRNARVALLSTDLRVRLWLLVERVSRLLIEVEIIEWLLIEGELVVLDGHLSVEIHIIDIEIELTKISL